MRLFFNAMYARKLHSALFYKTYFPCELRLCVTQGETCDSYNSCELQSIARAQVLATIEKNGYVKQAWYDLSSTLNPTIGALQLIHQAIYLQRK